MSKVRGTAWSTFTPTVTARPASRTASRPTTAAAASALPELLNGDGPRVAVDGDGGAVRDPTGAVGNRHDARDAQLTRHDHGVAYLRAHVNDDRAGGYE